MTTIIVEDGDAVAHQYGTAAPSGYTFANERPVIVVTENVTTFGLWGVSGGAGGGRCVDLTGTLTLTYDDTNARVQIVGAALDAFSFVTVERSTDNMHWTTVRNAVAIELVAGAFTLYDYEFIPGVTNYYRLTTVAPSGCSSVTETITPDLTQVWIKSVTRPFLNQALGTACASAFGAEDIELLTNPGATRPTRVAVFPIINRTMPVGVTDLALGRAWTLRLRTHTLAKHREVDYLFASGDVLFIQVPASDCAQTIEHGYVVVNDPAYERHHRYRNRVVWETDVQEVAPPAADIEYAEATWATVIAQFGSWADLVAACPTWNDVLALLPDPSEVIVP